jgi:hypothetical protein
MDSIIHLKKYLRETIRYNTLDHIRIPYLVFNIYPDHHIYLYIGTDIGKYIMCTK